jgi:hypothetical protein
MTLCPILKVKISNEKYDFRDLIKNSLLPHYQKLLDES